jgi:hypothetical protein
MAREAKKRPSSEFGPWVLPPKRNQNPNQKTTGMPLLDHASTDLAPGRVFGDPLAVLRGPCKHHEVSTCMIGVSFVLPRCLMAPYALACDLVFAHALSTAPPTPTPAMNGAPAMPAARGTTGIKAGSGTN